MRILPFYQKGCEITGVYSLSSFLVLSNFFSFHISDQRKEAKERRFIVYYIFLKAMKSF